MNATTLPQTRQTCRPPPHCAAVGHVPGGLSAWSSFAALLVLRCVMLAALFCAPATGVNSVASVTSAASLRIDPALAQTDLATAGEMLEDPDGKLTLADVQKPQNAQRFQPRSGNIGLTASAWWLRFTLVSGAPAENTWWLNSGNRTLQEIALFSPDANGVYQQQSASSGLPFQARPLRTANFVFPVTLQPQKPTDIYLRVRSTSFIGVNLAPRLWQPEAYQAVAGKEKSQWLFYLGLSCALCLFNLVLYLSIRDINYLLYVTSAMTILWATSSALGGFGSAYEYLWPNAPRFEQTGWLLSIFASAFFPVTFAFTFTNFRASLPRTWWFLQLCLLAFGLTITMQLAGIWLERPDFAATAQILNIPGVIIFGTLYAGVVASLSWLAWHGNRQATFLCLSWLPAIVIGGFFVHHLLLGSPFDVALTLWGSTIQLVFVSLALSDRLNQERIGRGLAQAAVVDALRRSEQALEEKVSQRTLELQQEQRRTQELLYNIFPADIAAELSETGQTRPVRHEAVSILFTDFIGFTQTVSTMPANRMVSELNQIFAAFDDITDAYGVEKVKTVGDAYMAVAGLPRPCNDHAQRCVRAALQMAAYLEQRNQKAAFKWTLRIGIHSGPVVAGVVGKRKLAFDLWGDAVTIAARMEHAGEDGRVNISADTWQLVRNEFQCEYRGKPDPHSKEPIDMYFVTPA